MTNKMCKKDIAWTDEEIQELKNIYHKYGIVKITELINKINPNFERTENSIMNRASILKLKSKKQVELINKKKAAENLIREGKGSLIEIAEKTGLHIRTIDKIYYTIVKRTEKKEVAGIPSEDWEDFYLNQPTPKGYECPKLHTKQLNTYK